MKNTPLDKIQGDQINMPIHHFLKVNTALRTKPNFSTASLNLKSDSGYSYIKCPEIAIKPSHIDMIEEKCIKASKVTLKRPSNV